MSYENIEDLRRPVGLTNKLLGWVVLIDHLGRIRWVAHGNAKPEELETLINISNKLLK
jgi:ATPase complex subunit ATP10